MNENIEYNNSNIHVNKETVRKIAAQRLTLMINEQLQKGASNEEIQEFVRQFHALTLELMKQFDEQKEVIESARKQIEKEQNQNPYEMGGRTR